MQLSNQSLEEFRTLYKEEFGEECTIEEAREMATRLFTLYESMYQWEKEQRKPPST